MVKFTTEQLEFMRADLETNFGYTKIIEAAQKVFKEQGRDFDKEFKKWQSAHFGGSHGSLNSGLRGKQLVQLRTNRFGSIVNGGM